MHLRWETGAWRDDNAMCAWSSANHPLADVTAGSKSTDCANVTPAAVGYRLIVACIQIRFSLYIGL